MLSKSPSISQMRHTITSSKSWKGHCSGEGAWSGGAGDIGRRSCCCLWEVAGGDSRFGAGGGQLRAGDFTSPGEGGGRDWAGLGGSSLTSLTVESREGDSTVELSRRPSGEDRETRHLSRPVGPGCPLQGILHFLQVRAAAAAEPGAVT